MRKDSGSTGSWDYLDFELEVREGGPREYPLAIRSPAGEAQEEMRFPFDEWELKDRLQALEIALLRSGGTRRRIPSPEEHTVQDFGRGLFESLLVGDVRTRYEMSLSEARRQGKGLRLKLRIHPPELAVLPWEFLYDAERDRYPSLSSNTPLVRYLDLPQPVEPLRVSPPLRILGMVTSPLGLDPLDVEHEKRLVEEAIKGLRENGLLELTWLEGQTWRHLQRAMRRGPWHVFHFVGHGGFDPATEEGAIALSDEAGRKRLLRATSLAELLDDHYPLRLVFLNSCEGAKGSESDAFSSTAATLVRRGIPAVVAMQYEVTDKAAIEFSRDFYDAVADGLPVDAAVTEARAAVSMDSALEWGTPVLYMRSPDGRIFDISTSAPRAQPTPETEDRQEEYPLRRYREGVESAWADGVLQANEVQQLRDLANNELRLSPGTAADIEREVMGGTIETILERQEEAAREEERNRRLEELYTEARRLYVNRKWQAVIDNFEQIRAEDPAYPDREGLLGLAREALEAQDLARRVAAVYAEGKRHLDAGEWQQALECFEEVQRLKPGYRQTGEMLARIHQVQSPDRTEQAEASEGSLQQIPGHPTDQAERVQPGDFAETQPRAVLPAGAGHWWALALRGGIAVFFGLLAFILAFALPDGLPLLGLIVLFAPYSLVDGVTAIIGAFGDTRGRTQRWPLLVEGLASILTSLIALFFPDLTAIALLYLIAAWAIVTGLAEIATAIRLRREIRGEWALIVGGVFSVLFGVILAVVGSSVGLLSLIWLIGFYAVAFGFLLLITAARVRTQTEVETAG